MGLIKVVETKTHIGEIEEEKVKEVCEYRCRIDFRCSMKKIEEYGVCGFCLATLMTDYGLELKRK